MRTYHLLAVALLSLFLSQRAPAAVVVDVQDVQLDAGQFGFVDVLISGTNDAVSLFNYEFAIANAGANVGSLRFATPQQSDELTDANYIFNGDSGGFSSAPQNGAVADSIQGGDLSASFVDVNLTTARLLVRLDIEHVLPMGTDVTLAESDEFTITLQNTANSFFNDSSFAAAPIDASSFAALGAGTVSFAATSVPEPSAATTFIVAASAVVCRRRRRNGRE